MQGGPFLGDGEGGEAGHARYFPATLGNAPEPGKCPKVASRLAARACHLYQSKVEKFYDSKTVENRGTPRSAHMAIGSKNDRSPKIESTQHLGSMPQ